MGFKDMLFKHQEKNKNKIISPAKSGDSTPIILNEPKIKSKHQSKYLLLNRKHIIFFKLMFNKNFSKII